VSSHEAGGRLSWFWNRLRCMSPAEVLHRSQYALLKRAQRSLGLGALQAETSEQLQGGVRWVLPRPAEGAVDSAHYLAEAERIAQGSVRLFASQRFEVGAEPQWNRCPLTGVQAPLRPAHALSITDRSQVGDIKYLWELNRHLHWVALAQAWALSGQRQHLDTLALQLRSWLTQCPYGQGPNWTSSLEYAIRLLNWSLVWQLIGGLESPLFQGPDGQALRSDWLRSINLHVRAISQHYSRHSSANNHLVGELAGVFVAAAVWPFWRSVTELATKARAELLREIDLQVAPDGVLREQAFEYATFTFDFFLAAERAAAAAGQPMPASYRERMAAMCRFVASVTTRRAAVPQVGDADGAEAFRLDPRPGRDCFAAMQQKGAALMKQPAWLPQPQHRRDDAAWLDWAAGALDEPGAASAGRGLDFPDGGYFLFGRDLGGPQEILGLVDAGPLGYLGIAAHGHADALQLWLSVAGIPVLIDPGTYSYWAEKKWRDYFRGTSAHNTVRVGGIDQSLSGGRFMWTRKAQICANRSIKRTPEGDLSFSAGHDGYKFLPGRPLHSREVQFAAQSKSLRVLDRVESRTPELIELFWHIAPDWTIEVEGEARVRLCHGEGLQLVLQIKAPVPGRLDIVSAQEDPPLGWYSAGYGERCPSPTIRWTTRSSSIQLETLIEVISM
jgi:hypothetical protein